MVTDDSYKRLCGTFEQTARKKLANGGKLGRVSGDLWVSRFRSETLCIRSCLGLPIDYAFDILRPYLLTFPGPPFNGAYRAAYGRRPVLEWPDGDGWISYDYDDRQ
jgi:hypothetical protein